MAKNKKRITFAQACFISGMSADTLVFLEEILTDEQKKAFVQNERDTCPCDMFKKAMESDLFPEVYDDKLY